MEKRKIHGARWTSYAKAYKEGKDPLDWEEYMHIYEYLVAAEQYDPTANHFRISDLANMAYYERGVWRYDGKKKEIYSVWDRG